MLYALDSDGMRVDADGANRDEKYTCPICSKTVILKQGQVNIAHFAHESNECDDYWNYDMSEWHKRMQNYFPKESQEVVVSYRGRKHRADVLIGDIVLEFQFSPITASEFEDRNKFFKNAGYRLAWIFNLSHISDDSLYRSDEKECMMIWKHPMRIFANSDYLGENNKKFALWFAFSDYDEFEEIDIDYMYRVVWAIKDEDGCYSMRRFYTSDYSICFTPDSVINPKEFFDYKGERSKQRILDFKQKLLELRNNCSFSVKYKGKKGEPRGAYICPRKNGEFGIDLWGEHGCHSCRYCYMIATTEKEDRNMYASYCCYPNQVRELIPSEERKYYDDDFMGECFNVDEYEI